MTILPAIILGAIQGITSLMPVSSSGHVMVAGHFLGADAALTLRMQSFLHIGTLIALLIILNRDVIRLVLAFAGIIQDLYFNGKTFIRNIGHSEQGNYRKVVCTNYRKLLLLLLTAMVPTIILASLLRGAAILASGNLLIAAMGFFVTALMLFVVSFMTRGDRKIPQILYRHAIIIGAMQGIAAVPGISRFGMVLTTSGLCGISRRTAVKIAYLLAIPSIIGSLLINSGSKAAGITAAERAATEAAAVIPSVGVGSIILGILASAVVSYLFMKVMGRLMIRDNNRGFAVYCVAAGIFSIFAYFH